MRRKDVDVIEIFAKAFKESEGKTIDLIIEHELHDITPEMVRWFLANSDEYYKLWHPGDHVEQRWVVPPESEDNLAGSLKVAVEKFGDLPVCELLMSRESPGETPFDKST